MMANRVQLLRQDYPSWTPQVEQQNQQPPEEDDDSDLDLTEGIDNDQDGAGGDADDDQDDDQGGDDDGSSDDGEGDDNQAPPWVSAFEQRMTSEIDRRINSAMNKQNRRQGPQQKQQSRQQEQRQPAAADERGARLVLRETLNESMTFLSPEERSAAIQYGKDKIAARAARGFEDPDEVGEKVAGEVKAFVEQNRKFYSGRTRSLLKKKGLLVEQKQQQDTTPGKGVGDATKGAAKALEMRQRVTPGYKAPGQ